MPRQVIEWALSKKMVKEKLVRAVMQLYDGAKTRVVVRKVTTSEAFDVKVGLYQRSVLLPFLFAIVLDVVCINLLTTVVPQFQQFCFKFSPH